MIDNFCSYIKSTLPKLTNMFGENIIDIESIQIANKEVYIKTKSKNNLKTNQKVFISGVKYPIKIVSVENDIIETETVHNLLSHLTKQVFITNLKLENEILEGWFDLILDVDYNHLQIDFKGKNYDFTNAYLVLQHNEIINGLREIEIIDENTFKIKNFTLNIKDTILEIEGANISIGQRVYGCFDLDDAINIYCNSIGLNDLEDEIDSYNKLNLRFKDNNNLTCFVGIDTDTELMKKNIDSAVGGFLVYTLNIYVFVPLKGNNKYKQRELIEYITYGLFCKMLGEKSFEGNSYLTQQFTNSCVFSNSEKAIGRNNVLYIHNIKFNFGVRMCEKDFKMDNDYWRLNSLNLTSLEKGYNILY